jgi:thymidine phosphorylase
MLPQEIVRAKRDGTELGHAAITDFVRGITDGSVAEGQAAAFAMAVYFQGMTTAEAVALTEAMQASGTTLRWSLDGPVVDKHSTGGVGDTVSLMLAPMVAACGGYVPMISGRGLGHTGGTYDKMESIPGYVATPSLAEFQRVVADVGCAIIGQTPDLAPADKRLYAIRDVTATVESVPLITASILSKKLAAGLDALAMDVKVGNGAFMTTPARAAELARSIVDVAEGAGVRTTALITDMDQPLTDTAGNALEVLDAIAYLTGTRRQPRIHEVTVALCAEMLVLSGISVDVQDARARLMRALDSGAAAERFAAMVRSLGGPADLLDRPNDHLAVAPVSRVVHAAQEGRVVAIDTRGVGMAVVALGGGRTRPQDDIDHGVGLVDLAALGDAVGPAGSGARPIGRIIARDDTTAAAAERRLLDAYTVGDPAPTVVPVVHDRVTRR